MRCQKINCIPCLIVFRYLLTIVTVEHWHVHELHSAFNKKNISSIILVLREVEGGAIHVLS